VADREGPAVAEVADLVLVEAVVLPADGDGDAGDRDGELGDRDDLTSRLVVADDRDQDRALLVVGATVGAVEIEDVAAVRQGGGVEGGQRGARAARRGGGQRVDLGGRVRRVESLFATEFQNGSE
jgi:hypothetical protein